MYSVSAYGRMIADAVRVKAYEEAMRRAITADSVVLEIGTGTGLFALLACRMGARRVYAIETSEAIHLAAMAARDNGCADRIQFIQKMSTEVTLPEPADVLVSDLHGITPFLTQHIPSVIDARRRLLRPGATLIPLRESLHAALAEVPEEYERIAGPWAPSSHGIDWRAARAVVVNEFYKLEARPEALLTDALQWAELEYATVESPNAARTLSFRANRAGTAHGFVLWFDCETAPGVGFSNAPGGDGAIYQSAFFPFERPLALKAGGSVEMDLRADLFGSQYVWTWKTRSPAMVQSTFRSIVATPASARRVLPGFRPSVSEAGLSGRWLLERMDGTRTNQELAEGLRERFPALFPTLRQAMDRVIETAKSFP